MPDNMQVSCFWAVSQIRVFFANVSEAMLGRIICEKTAFLPFVTR